MSQSEVWLKIIEMKHLDTVNGAITGSIIHGLGPDKDGSSCQMGCINFIDFNMPDCNAWQQDLMTTCAVHNECASSLVNIQFNPGECSCNALDAAACSTSKSVHAFSKQTMLCDLTNGSKIFTPFQDIHFGPVKDVSFVSTMDPLLF